MLEEHLAIAKSVDIDRLAQKAALPMASNREAEMVPFCTTGLLQTFEDRIMRAKCISNLVEKALQDLQQYKEAEASERADASPAEANVQEESELPSSSSEGEGMPSEIDSDAEAAIAKLLRVHKESDEASLEEDSGVFEIGDSDQEWLQEEGLFNNDSVNELQSDSGKQKRVSVLKAQKKKPARPPKKKNRLGQRARKRLAGTVEVRKKASPIKKKLEEKQVHPSWAAKQSQKVAIGTSRPQGKKIIFDDGKPADDTTTLHPSWAAKKSRAPIMAEASGKRITFDD